MFPTLITHTWLMFRRSELFEKSLGVIAFLGFLAFLMLMQLTMAGRLLPGILLEHFPQKQPAEWVYGALLPLMFSDLLTRFFFQGMPSTKMKPYLHLPLSRNTIGLYWIVRAWLHPINLYLLFFFHPFILNTINPATHSQTAGLLGIASLVAINQSLVMWLRQQERKGLILLLAAALLSATWLIAPERISELSMALFMAFINQNILVFAALVATIIVLHLLTFRQLDQELKKIFSGDGLKNRSLNLRIPGGPLWQLEWQLLTRNKRSRTSFYMMIPIAVGVVIYLATQTQQDMGFYSIILLLLAGSYGNSHLQHAFSWESHYFDFLATRNISMTDFLVAKYRFYVTYATLQLLILLPPLLYFNSDMAILYTGVFLYACGFGYWFYLRMGARHSARIDPSANASFNVEGVSGMKIFQSMLLVFTLIPFLIAAAFVTIPHALALMMGVIGLTFMLSHRWWIMGVAKTFGERKYKNLALYRL